MARGEIRSSTAPPQIRRDSAHNLGAIEHQKLVGPITAGHIFWASTAIGRNVQRCEHALRKLVNARKPDCGAPALSGAQRIC
jgi:hypothetical protein